jgi:hypothetical protein
MLKMHPAHLPDAKGVPIRKKGIAVAGVRRRWFACKVTITV